MTPHVKHNSSGPPRNFVNPKDLHAQTRSLCMPLRKSQPAVCLNKFSEPNPRASNTLKCAEKDDRWTKRMKKKYK